MTRQIAILVVGVLLILGPLWGLLAALHGKSQALDALASEHHEPERLKSSINLALYTTGAGIVAFPIGLWLTRSSWRKLRAR